MRRSLLVSLGLVLGLAVGGCSQPVESVDDSARLSVNDTLRAACQPLSDDQILQVVLYYEQRRSSAVPYETEVGFALSGCQGFEATGSSIDGIPESYNCDECAAAILSQVYGAENNSPLEVAAPTVAPSGGRFSTPQDIQITCTTAGATVYFTTDGTDPTAGNGSRYAGPVHLEATATLRAAARVNWTFSPVTSAEFVRQYLLSVATDGSGSVTPDAGLYVSGTQVQLQAIPGAGWHFDHWEGDASGLQPVATVALNGDTSVKAFFKTDDLNTVQLDAVIVGNGRLFVTPIGTPVGFGYTYLLGTYVRLSAVAVTGWQFSGWYTTDSLLVNVNSQMDVVLTSNTNFIAIFQEMTPPPLLVPANCVVLAGDGRALGVISTNTFNTDSLANPYGTYGSKYAFDSIWNRYGAYGSPYTMYSPYNPYTNTPPIIFQNGTSIGFLTKNTLMTPRFDPDDLAIALGRYDVLRN